jgi:F420-0:gamma-glutamyl ligase-like protein
METKYCSYNVLSAKGKRKYNRRSCKKTSNSAENSDLCEVLNKRCGLKENHDRRVYRQTHSKKLSRNNRVKSVQRKPNDTKRPVVVDREAPRKVEPRPVVVAKEAPVKLEQRPVVVAKEAPRKVEQRPVVVAKEAPRKVEPRPVVVAKEAPVKLEQRPVVVAKEAPRKVEPRPVVVAKEAPVAVKELRSSKSQDTKEYKRIVNELQRYGKSRAYYSNADFVNTGSRWQAEEDKKKYDDEVQLFEEIKQQYGSDIINITTTNSPEDSRLDWIDTFISVNPTMKDKFDSMV